MEWRKCFIDLIFCKLVVFHFWIMFRKCYLVVECLQRLCEDERWKDGGWEHSGALWKASQGGGRTPKATRYWDFPNTLTTDNNSRGIYFHRICFTNPQIIQTLLYCLVTLLSFCSIFALFSKSHSASEEWPRFLQSLPSINNRPWFKLDFLKLKNINFVLHHRNLNSLPPRPIKLKGGVNFQNMLPTSSNSSSELLLSFYSARETSAFTVYSEFDKFTTRRSFCFKLM